jgi:L-amino acid N-acyltransferase YncA
MTTRSRNSWRRKNSSFQEGYLKAFGAMDGFEGKRAQAIGKKTRPPKVSSMVRAVKYADAARITEIYNHYILNTLITFEEHPLSPEEILARIKSITAEYPWLVYEDNGRVVGYAYAIRWKERSAYRHTVEAAIYVDVQDTGKHLGSQLTAALLDELRAMNIHSVLAGIALPNAASVALCEKFGCVKVGQLKEVGYKLNQWVDVGYWELILNDLGEASKM